MSQTLKSNMATDISAKGASAGDVDHPPVGADMEKNEQEYSEKPAPGADLDYSGAAAKVDPVEIKLVRKLDIWIMVRSSRRCSFGTELSLADKQ